MFRRQLWSDKKLAHATNFLVRTTALNGKLGTIDINQIARPLSLCMANWAP